MMVDNNKIQRPWHFERGLGQEFISALKALANKRSWFWDILQDSELILGIREEYMNVYVDGQSLFKIAWDSKNKKINVTTHPKYLVDPALRKPVAFVGEQFDIKSIKAFAESYVGKATLKRMKKAARIYSGIEKKGVQKVVHANADVVDLEIALSMTADREETSEDAGADDSKTARGSAKRIDIACFEEIDGEIHLCFWEAKDYGNAELWASGDTLPPVVHQVSGYEKLIKEHLLEIMKSYRTVAKNLVCLAEMGRVHKLGKLLTQVANDAEFLIDTPARVGVVLFGFDTAQRGDDRHKLMLKKLQREGLAVVAKGEPKGMTLKWKI